MLSVVSPLRQRPDFTDIIPLFDRIVLEAILTDKMGRKLWQKHFLTKDQLRHRVPWPEFASAFCQFFKETRIELDDIRMQCLNALLVDGARDEEVDMEEWAKLLQWFGPLKDLGMASLSFFFQSLTRPDQLPFWTTLWIC